MVKLQLVEESRPCEVADSVKCRRVKATITMPQRLYCMFYGKRFKPTP